jgi:hypothetical protein
MTKVASPIFVYDALRAHGMALYNSFDSWE